MTIEDKDNYSRSDIIGGADRHRTLHDWLDGFDRFGNLVEDEHNNHEDMRR